MFIKIKTKAMEEWLLPLCHPPSGRNSDLYSRPVQVTLPDKRPVMFSALGDCESLIVKVCLIIPAGDWF
jgi:hypothetical protein